MTKNFRFLSFFLGTFLLIPVFAFAQSTTTASTTNRFVVPLSATNTQLIAQQLLDANIISNINDVNSLATITPGGYKLTTGMPLVDVLKVLSAKPYMVWVVIPPGLRKEEVADILVKNLGWTKVRKASFLKLTTQNYNYLEGVYFPDTYLIPYNEDPQITYKRFISKFNENFGSYQKQFVAQNFPWLKALTLASLVQREAGSVDDMPIIAGILLNRVNQKIALGVDSTVQYIRGDKNTQKDSLVKYATTTAYWAQISVTDKKIDSKYNTYKYKGLPPHPIDSPSLAAIEAVLNPATTTCLYYLHDSNRQIHCADTYDQHLQNIETYLKNN